MFKKNYSIIENNVVEGFKDKLSTNLNQSKWYNYPEKFAKLLLLYLIHILLLIVKVVVCVYQVYKPTKFSLSFLFFCCYVVILRRLEL